MSGPKTIFLKDYKPSDFIIDSIDLTLDIQDEETVVDSTLKLFKRKELRGTASNLVLQGEGLSYWRSATMEVPFLMSAIRFLVTAW